MGRRKDAATQIACGVLFVWVGAPIPVNLRRHLRLSQATYFFPGADETAQRPRSTAESPKHGCFPRLFLALGRQGRRISFWRCVTNFPPETPYWHPRWMRTGEPAFLAPPARAWIAVWPRFVVRYALVPNHRAARHARTSETPASRGRSASRNQRVDPNRGAIACLPRSIETIHYRSSWRGL